MGDAWKPRHLRTAYKYMYQMYGEGKTLDQVSFQLVKTRLEGSVEVATAVSEYAGGVATAG